MKPEIKQMITSLENRLLEEIYSILENDYENEDDIELQFNVGKVTYEALRVYRDDDGKVDSVEADESWLDSDGQIYSESAELVSLGLSVLIAVLDSLEKSL